MHLLQRQDWLSPYYYLRLDPRSCVLSYRVISIHTLSIHHRTDSSRCRRRHYQHICSHMTNRMFHNKAPSSNHHHRRHLYQRWHRDVGMGITRIFLCLGRFEFRTVTRHSRLPCHLLPLRTTASAIHAGIASIACPQGSYQ